MKFLLDTNTCIAVMRNHPQVLPDKMFLLIAK